MIICKKQMRNLKMVVMYLVLVTCSWPSLEAHPSASPTLFIENLQTIRQRSGYQLLVLKGEKLHLKASSALSRLYTPLTKEFVQYVEKISKQTQLLSIKSPLPTDWKSLLLECYFSLRSLEYLYVLHNKQPNETQLLHQALKNLYKAIQEMPFSEKREWIDSTEQKEDSWKLKYLESTNPRVFSEPDMHTLRLLRFSPLEESATQTKTKRILLCAIHGTQLSIFSHVGKKFTAENTPIYQTLKALAQSISIQENKTVDLLIVNWSGINTNEARIQAGTALASLMEKHFPSDQYEDYSLGVSHGGNVLFWAFGLLETSNRVVKKMILLATPHRADFPPPALQAGGVFYNFYNPWDATQYMGSFEITTRPSDRSTPVDPRRMRPSSLVRNEIHNFQVRFDNRNPYHPEMKYLIFALPELFHKNLDASQLHYKLTVDNYLEVKKTQPLTPEALARLELSLTPDEEMNPNDEEDRVEDPLRQFGFCE